jgi:hypothetical protein
MGRHKVLNTAQMGDGRESKRYGKFDPYPNEKSQIQGGKIHGRKLCTVSAAQHLKHSQMLQLGYGMGQNADQKEER